MRALRGGRFPFRASGSAGGGLLMFSVITAPVVAYLFRGTVFLNHKLACSMNRVMFIREPLFPCFLSEHLVRGDPAFDGHLYPISHMTLPGCVAGSCADIVQRLPPLCPYHLSDVVPRTGGSQG